MTFEEFKKKEIEGDLLHWISKDERSEKHWMLSVEDWASMRYREAYDKEQNLKEVSNQEA